MAEIVAPGPSSPDGLTTTETQTTTTVAMMAARMLHDDVITRHRHLESSRVEFF